LAIIGWTVIMFKTGGTLNEYSGILPDHIAVVGNPSGNVNIVEFFDYRCGYCRNMPSTLDKIMEENRQVKITLVEYPIFGGSSTLAAKSALAVHKLDPSKYYDYHKELLAYNGEIDEDAIKDLAGDAGLSGYKVLAEIKKPEYDTMLAENEKIARAFGVRGTPHFVVNGETVRGAISYEDLKEKIEEKSK